VTAQRQLIAAAAGVAAVLLLVFFVLIGPRRSQLGEVRAQTQQELDRTQQLEAERDRLLALEQNAPQLQARLAELRQLVPSENEVANFVFEVEAAANAAGVGFVQITPELPKPPPEGAALAEVRATIGAGGGYFSVQDFLRRLYELDRAVRVDTLTMTGVEGEEAVEDGRINVLLAARIFFELPEGAEVAAAGTATTPTAPTTPAPAPSP
jgi:Tfp pilus assembly protein PilO